MAKSDNFFELRGKIGNLIFCQRNGKTYVKRYSGGFVNGNSHNHPNAKKAQNNFKEISVAAKELRNTMIPFLLGYKESNFYNQCVAYCARLKKKHASGILKEAFENQQLLLSSVEKWINQSSKLRPDLIYWDKERNTLRFNKDGVEAVLKKYPNASCAIHFAQIQWKENAQFHALNTHFLLVNNENLIKSKEIEWSIKNFEEEGQPWIALSFVYRQNNQPILIHPNQYSLIAFL